MWCSSKSQCSAGLRIWEIPDTGSEISLGKAGMCVPVIQGWLRLYWHPVGAFSLGHGRKKERNFFLKSPCWGCYLSISISLYLSHAEERNKKLKNYYQRFRCSITTSSSFRRLSQHNWVWQCLPSTIMALVAHHSPSGCLPVRECFQFLLPRKDEVFLKQDQSGTP